MIWPTILAGAPPGLKPTSPLFKPREKTIDPLEGPTGRTVWRSFGGEQVLFDGKRRKYLTPLRHETDTRARDPIAGPPRDFGGRHCNATSKSCAQAHDGANERSFTHSISTHQRHHFTLSNGEVDTEKYLGVAVSSLKLMYRQHGVRHWSHPLDTQTGHADHL